MQKKKPYIILLGVYILLIVIIALASPKKVDWTPTFSLNDKIAYGDYILYKQLSSLFPAKKVDIVNTPFYNFAINRRAQKDSTASNYIFINERFKPDMLDIHKLLSFVSAGNSVFIASAAVPDSLLDTLHISFENKFHYGLNPLNTDTEQALYQMNFTNPALHKQGGYNFKKRVSQF